MPNESVKPATQQPSQQAPRPVDQPRPRTDTSRQEQRNDPRPVERRTK
ncbi:hypothetical protein [Spirosoma litoris]